MSCNDQVFANGVWIGVEVIASIAILSVFIVFTLVLCLLRKKSQSPNKADKVTWKELQEEDEEITGLEEE